MLVSSSALVLYAALNTCFLQRPKIHHTREMSIATSPPGAQQPPVLGVAVDLADIETAHGHVPTVTPLLAAEAAGPAVERMTIQDQFNNAEITVVSARAVGDGAGAKESRDMPHGYIGDI